MTKMKTLSLKLALSILVGVLAVVCLTASVVLAAFSVPSTIITSTVNVAKISAQVWSDATATTEITSANIDSASTLYISATKEGVAIDIPCVMRVSPTFNVTGVDTNKWIQQANGWYYYVGIVGGGYAGDYGTKSNDAIQFGTKSATTGGHISVELMQFSTSTTGGFIKEWSPLAGKSAEQVQLSSSTTIDGLNLHPKGTSVNTYFSVFSGNTVKMPLSQTDTPTTSNSLMTDTLTATGSGTNYSYSGTVNLNYLSNGNMKIYNNVCLPMIFLVDFTYEALNVGNGATISNLTVSVNRQANWGIVGDNTSAPALTTLNSGKNSWIYSKAVMPGQYVDIISPSINVSFSADKATSLNVRLVTTITVIDVDTFISRLSSDYSSYSGKIATTEAPYYCWVNAMESYWTTNGANLTTIGGFPEAGFSDITGSTTDDKARMISEQSSANTASFSGQVANP